MALTAALDSAIYIMHTLNLHSEVKGNYLISKCPICIVWRVHIVSMEWLYSYTAIVVWWVSFSLATLNISVSSGHEGKQPILVWDHVGRVQYKYVENFTFLIVPLSLQLCWKKKRACTWASLGPVIGNCIWGWLSWARESQNMLLSQLPWSWAKHVYIDAIRTMGGTDPFGPSHDFLGRWNWQREELPIYYFSYGGHSKIF